MSNLTITRRHLPHWTLDGAWYYVTFRLRAGGFTDQELQIVLEHVRFGHGRLYRLIAACVMPDHVHVILSPIGGRKLPGVMKGLKGTTAHALNKHRGTRGILWQSESWDRILRDDAELQQKFSYMLMNPVEEGLTDDPWSYRGWYLQT